MKTKVILGVVTILILSIALTSIGSNMGFKLSVDLTAGQAKYISLPYYNSYSTQTAQILRNDVVAAGGSTTGTEVFNWNGTAWQRYAGGGLGQVNFALEKGIGYEVKTTNGVTGWVIVGSHDPSVTISFDAGKAKYVAVPYHTTSTTAQLLRNEIVNAGGSPTGTEVFNWNGTAWQRYAGGGLGQVNFSITPGLAIEVKTTNGCGPWTPAHY